MNIRQTYLEEVIKVEEYKLDIKCLDKYKFVKVKMKINYKGSIVEHEKIFDNYEWDLVQRHGYYLD